MGAMMTGHKLFVFQLVGSSAGLISPLALRWAAVGGEGIISLSSMYLLTGTVVFWGTLVLIRSKSSIICPATILASSIFVYYVLPLACFPSECPGYASIANERIDDANLAYLASFVAVLLAIASNGIAATWLSPNQGSRGIDSEEGRGGKLQFLIVAMILSAIVVWGYVGIRSYIGELSAGSVSGTAFRTTLNQGLEDGHGRHMIALRFVDFAGLFAGAYLSAFGRGGKRKWLLGLLLICCSVFSGYVGSLTLGRLNTLMALLAPFLGFFSQLNRVRLAPWCFPLGISTLLIAIAVITPVFRDSVQSFDKFVLRRVLSVDIGRIHDAANAASITIQKPVQLVYADLATFMPGNGGANSNTSCAVYSSQMTGTVSNFFIPGALGSFVLWLGPFGGGFLFVLFVFAGAYACTWLNSTKNLSILGIVFAMYLVRNVIPHSMSNWSGLLLICFPTVIAFGSSRIACRLLPKRRILVVREKR